MIAALSLQQPNRASPPPVHLVAVSQLRDTCFSFLFSLQNPGGRILVGLPFILKGWFCVEVLMCLNLMFVKPIYFLFWGVLVGAVSVSVSFPSPLKCL